MCVCMCLINFYVKLHSTNVTMFKSQEVFSYRYIDIDLIHIKIFRVNKLVNYFDSDNYSFNYKRNINSQ